MRLTYERLRKVLDYDPDTGKFTWRISRGTKAKGSTAGSIQTFGYIQISIDSIPYLASHLAFLWMTGGWPKEEMDHINKIPNDDRWCNLREATRSQNCTNKFTQSTTLFKGVCEHGQKFQAKIKVDGLTIHLGTFEFADEAHAAYMKAAEQFFGEFACPG